MDATQKQLLLSAVKVATYLAASFGAISVMVDLQDVLKKLEATQTGGKF